MSKQITVAAALALGLCLAGRAAAEPKPSDDKALLMDQQFMKKAASGGLLEVQLGELALKQAHSPAVRQFAKRMVKDHGMANKQLMLLLSMKGVTPPKGLDRKDREALDQLSRLKGAAFDRAYMKHMVADHTQDVTLFEQEAKDGKDVQLKAYAVQTLPVLKEHLLLARQARDKVQAGAE